MEVSKMLLTSLTLLLLLGARSLLEFIHSEYIALTHHHSSILWTNIISFFFGMWFWKRRYDRISPRPTYDHNLNQLVTGYTTVDSSRHTMVEAPAVGCGMIGIEFEASVKIIESVPLLAQLDRSEVIEMAKRLKREQFSEGETLMVQGEDGDKFFIIKEGICQVEVVDKENVEVVAMLGNGDYCGEQALISWDAKRNATVRAKFQTKCLTLDRANFMQIFQDSNVRFAKRDAKRAAIKAENFEEITIDKSMITSKTPVQIQWLLSCVRKNLLFANYNEAQKVGLVEHMNLTDVKRSEVLIKQGDDGNEFYVIEEGVFKVSIKETQVAVLEKGMCVGELAMIYNAPRAATVVALTNGKVWSLHRATFRKVLMQYNQSESSQNIGFLKKVSLLNPLLKSELQLLGQAMETVNLKKGHVIFKQGDEGEKFYIIKTGGVTGVKESEGKKETFDLKSGDFFGERALLKNESRAATITCRTAVTVLSLSRYDFGIILGPLEDIMTRHTKIYDKRISQSIAPKRVSTIDLDLQMLKEHTKGVLGRGAFGTVTLVVDEERQNAYALKAISKLQVVHNKQTSQMLSEKKVMEHLNSDFVVNLIKTFKDDYWLYLLLDVCLGGELFTIHRRVGSFDEATARFFTSCVIEGFIHLHDHNIAYRDLKPENLVLDSDGYLKITDFGLSKFILDGNTFTMCGTPDYLAPEIITGQGHGLAVDWWALGVLIFELVASHAPFCDRSMNAMFKNIMICKFEFPKMFSPGCKDIVNRLLQVSPIKRLGVIKGGHKLLKQQAWFKGFDWEALKQKTFEVPMKPTVKSFDDLDNFKAEGGENKTYKFDLESIDMSWADDF